jgi:hypothetical protein
VGRGREEELHGVGVEKALSVICRGDRPGGDSEQAEPGGRGGPRVADEWPPDIGGAQGGDNWKEATDGASPESEEEEEFLKNGNNN